MVKAKKEPTTLAFPRSIVFPPDIDKRIAQDASAARRSFSGQVRYLIDIALQELGK